MITYPQAITSNNFSKNKRKNNLSRYINIVRALSVADFRLKYHDSILGYIWSMLNPLLMFGVYYFVFTKIFQSDIPDYPLFLLIGIINYAFFQDCTFSGLYSVGAKSGIIKKIYFPKSIIVFSSTSTSVFSYLINLSILIFLIITLRGTSPLALLTPIPVFCLIIFSMGVAFFLSTLYSFFRDVGQIWSVLTLVIFWLSPIVYNVEALPPPISTIVYFNPLTRIFVLMRHYLLYDIFIAQFLIMTIVYSVLTFFIGYYFFQKYQERLPELF